jgi:YggT family protein
MSQTITLLIQMVTQLSATLFLMRFYMRICMVGGNAPLASFIAKVTNPFTRIVSLFLPNIPRVDLAALALALGLLIGQAYATASYQQIDSQGFFPISFLSVFLYAGIKSFQIILDLLFFAILGKIILSWVSPESRNSISLQLLDPLTEWILAPVRRIIPTVGMIDFSPIIVIFALQFFENFVLKQLL